MTASPVPVGAVIAGKYRVERVLGAGAMGVVVAARHLDLLELRAIKLMLPAGQQSSEGVERFLREARAAARLKSQHVARVHDVGRLDDGAPYAVIEYLEGSDLKALLDARGTIPVAEAAAYLSQVCEAIGEAHAAGIVHRDLKPANLFLTRGPNGAPIVKVLDFGIAKMAAADGAAADMTATSAMLGTPLYMSPEQMRGARDVDGRADIWALGVILYRMLTGRTPFSGSSVTEICAAVVADTPPPPRSLRGELTPEIEAVILRCLQKDPNQRFASVAEFAGALAFAAGATASAGAPASGGPSVSLMGTMVMDPPSATGAASATFGGAPQAASATFGAAPQAASATFGAAPQAASATFGAAPQAASATFGAAPQAASATFGAASGAGATAQAGATPPSQQPAPMPAAPPQPAWSGPPAWQASPQATAPPPSAPLGVPAPAWSPASAQGTWGATPPAAPPGKSRAGLFIGIAAFGLIGAAGVVAFLVWPSDSSPSPPQATAGPARPDPAAASPGTGAQPVSSGGSKPAARPGTPAFGQGPSPAASPSTGAGSPPAPGTSAAPSAPTAATSAAPGTSAAPSAPPAGASPKSIGALQSVLMTCWKGNEGANPGEPASSATVQVTVGPPRSVAVSGPAKARQHFTACVVTKASSTPFDPGDTVVVASASLPAGPP